MNKVNPFTYLVSSFLATTLGQAPAYCDASEYQTFFAPQGQSCAAYMQDYIAMAGGFLQDTNATSECRYCQMDSTNQFLQRVHASWDTRWRDFGLLWVYIAFNVAGAMVFYWLCRVPRSKKSKDA
jgi:ATP-binding cassette subfamily G (WHITE) protein 2 (PDR)